MPSNAEIDKLGARFQADPTDVATLSSLFQYCLLVKERTAPILPQIERVTSLPIRKRAGKSFLSIREKLDRGTLKLSAMQDIEGCRIITDTLIEQNALIFRLRNLFEKTSIYDRRSDPSNGYRAVHVVTRLNGSRYEVQVRTVLQHSWAEVSERLAGRFGQELKYGGVPQSDVGRAVSKALMDTSGGIEKFEEVEMYIWQLAFGVIDGPPEEMVDEIRFLLEHDTALPKFDEARSSAWADEAQRRLMTFRRMWQDSLVRDLEIGEI
jgi:ppGpp synthetase/RelA/SpoT-type nucleotidyltranferase